MKFTKNDDGMMETAYIWASKSYAKKRHVGAVISVNNRIVATGYNGTLPGHDNNCEDYVIPCNSCRENIILHNYNEDIVDPLTTYETDCPHCDHRNDHTGAYLKSNVALKTNEFVIHAEQNALMDAARYGKAVDGGTIYTTTSPCKTCAKLLAAGGIKEVVYSEIYRDTEGIDYLKKEGIRVRHYKKD